MNAGELWDMFLHDTGRSSRYRYDWCYRFGTDAVSADAILQKIMAGRKTASVSALPAYDLRGRRLPRVGDMSVILDGGGEPRCIIETTDVMAIPFSEVTAEIARRESGSATLAGWQADRAALFTADGQAAGYPFAPDMPVVIEDFRVVFRRPDDNESRKQ